jgi:hypothetical protein
VEISERAETKKTVHEERKRCFNSKDMSSSDEDSPSKKRKPSKAKHFRRSQDRKEFYCKEHGPNSTHNSADCEVIHGRSPDKQAWKSKDRSDNKCSDYKAKHKNKSRELHILQSQAKEAKNEAKEAKVKWTKAHKNLEANKAESSSESEGELKSVKETVREDKEEVFHLESSNNSSSSDSDSEQDAGCRENYVSERASKIKNKTVQQKECKSNWPHYEHMDEATDDASFLSDLREPAQTNTETDEEGQTLKKSKLNSLSPILFVKT